MVADAAMHGIRAATGTGARTRIETNIKGGNES